MNIINVTILLSFEKKYRYEDFLEIVGCLQFFCVSSAIDLLFCCLFMNYYPRKLNILLNRLLKTLVFRAKALLRVLKFFVKNVSYARMVFPALLVLIVFTGVEC